MSADPAHAGERLRLAEAMLDWRQAPDNGTLAGTVLTADGPQTGRFPRRAMAERRAPTGVRALTARGAGRG